MTLDRYIVDDNGCWLWTGPLSKEGYGRQGAQLAHRLMYARAKGPIPPSLDLDHLCRTRRCVNPDHLDAVTTRVNVVRGESFAAKNAAKTTCPNGHPYDSKVRGWRRCRACHNDKERARKRALRRQPGGG